MALRLASQCPGGLANQPPPAAGPPPAVLGLCRQLPSDPASEPRPGIAASSPPPPLASLLPLPGASTLPVRHLPGPPVTQHWGGGQSRKPCPLRSPPWKRLVGASSHDHCLEEEGDQGSGRWSCVTGHAFPFGL